MKWIHEDNRMYSNDSDGTLLAELTYIAKSNREVVIDHTFVNPSLRGQGVAGKMMAVFAGYLRENKMLASATCSYANAWLQKNREAYKDVISGSIDHENTACKTSGRH